MSSFEPLAFTPSWPHSLGQSVEWKLTLELKRSDVELCRPHSLGQSVEWKRFLSSLARWLGLGPTRWGNQLNGNLGKNG